MLNANEMLQKGIKQVKAAGITPGSINPNVVINNRAKNIFGKCSRVVGPYDYQIELNSELLKTTQKKAMNTMVHEILHTVEGCMNHGAKWTRLAGVMNEKNGYNISRNSSHEQLGIKRPKAKYEINCANESCDLKVVRYKKSKIVTHIHLYRCPHCSSDLKLKGAKKAPSRKLPVAQ